MSPHRIPADAVTPRPWKNGGGRTRELLAWPSANDWRLRISLADIMVRGGGAGAMQTVTDGQRWRSAATQCGLFSAVPGAWRCADGRGGKLPARTLLWFAEAPAGALSFHADQPAQRPLGWWLSFTANEG